LETRGLFFPPAGNSVADPAYAKAVEAFLKRRGELSCGPNADPDYVNAGY